MRDNINSLMDIEHHLSKKYRQYPTKNRSIFLFYFVNNKYNKRSVNKQVLMFIAIFSPPKLIDKINKKRLNNQF